MNILGRTKIKISDLKLKIMDDKMILLLNRIGKYERMTRRTFTYQSNTHGKGFLKNKERLTRKLKTK